MFFGGVELNENMNNKLEVFFYLKVGRTIVIDI